MTLRKTAEHTRAYIKIQDGCNQFCSYCIIPYTRGRVRSRGAEEVLKEVGALAAAGCKEIVLTGIHLSSYGKDLGEGESHPLLALIQKLHRIPGLCRIRLGSLEPRIITREFAASLAPCQRSAPIPFIPPKRLRSHLKADEPPLHPQSSTWRAARS